MKLYETVHSPDTTRDAKKGSNKGLETKLYNGSRLEYRIMYSESGLTVYRGEAEECLLSTKGDKQKGETCGVCNKLLSEHRNGNTLDCFPL